MTAPNRRWFRFSLRTLFVVVTVVGALLGWTMYQLNWIHHRHAFMARERAKLSNQLMSDWPANQSITITASDAQVESPRFLWLFGEASETRINLIVQGRSTALDPEDKKRLQDARRLFPEAQIGTIQMIGDYRRPPT